MNPPHAPIYCDYASGAPMDPVVQKALIPWLDATGNPNSIHALGVRARSVVNTARKNIARMLSVQSEEIIFSGSGTEAINMGILGVIRSAQEKGISIPHLITTEIEHAAVLEPLLFLRDRKEILLDFLPLRADGIVDTSSLKELLTKDTVLVAVMYANNEIGTIQPVREVAKIVRDWKKEKEIPVIPAPSQYPYVLTDACQAFPYLDCHVPRLGVDMLVLNGAKVGASQGIGLLYAHKGVLLAPLVMGGGQESGRRSGTEHVAGIVGLAQAMQIADEGREVLSGSVLHIRNLLISGLKEISPEIHVNGSLDNRLPNNLHVTIPGVDHQYLALFLDSAGIIVGTKSACRENDDGDSSVLVALRKAEETKLVPQGIRITLGKKNRMEDIPHILDAFRKGVPLALRSAIVTFST